MTIRQRLDQLPWDEMKRSLWDFGFAKAGPVLAESECADLIGLYSDASRFRSRVDMARHRFGVGDYKYFANPLPEIVRDLRKYLYPPLASVANLWMEALGGSERFPATLSELTARCHEMGQDKLTPLILHYEAGGYNCLHQDLYGDLAFPLQVVFLLSRPDKDYSGGEFLLLEQRPRAQSIGRAIRPSQGELVVFTTRYRPVKGSRGWYRANVRHGVSQIDRGARYTLGIIFHDAA